jgi:exodeoxyribonuclease VII large subunit
MSQTKFFTLSKITKRIGELLQPTVGKVFWVKAEIASGKERGGTFYCDLVETDKSGRIVAKMSCTIWMNDLYKIRKKFKNNNIDLKLDNGTSVGFLCSIQYSSQYGLSLKVTDADPAFALGVLELKKREIIKRLESEGLFELNKQKFVPMLPQKIGVITSRGSAAYNDFAKTLNTSPFGFILFLIDATMQGNLTERQVLAGLEVLKKLILNSWL